MLTAHYLHRLPADYDLNTVRTRAKGRGALWDAAPELYFKGFLLREAGKYGAIENSYSSLYLWRSDQAFADFLLTDRYRNVTNSFGRAQIDTRVVLDARRGSAQQTQLVFEETFDIARDVDLGQAFVREVERNRAKVARPGIVASVTAVDTLGWRFSRYLLAESADVRPDDAAITYEVVHLSQPLLHTLQGNWHDPASFCHCAPTCPGACLHNRLRVGAQSRRDRPSVASFRLNEERKT